MLNTYAALNAAQVRLISDALAEKFDNNQIHALFVALDGLGGSGGTAATATVRGTVLRAASVGTVTSANAGGTYTAAEQTLVNELKTDLNALIASLQAAGVIA